MDAVSVLVRAFLSIWIFTVLFMKYAVSVKLKAMLAPRIIDRPVRPRVQISGSMSRLDRTGVKLRRSMVFVLPPILGFCSSGRRLILYFAYC